MGNFDKVLPSFSIFKVVDMLYDVEYYFSTRQLAEKYTEEREFKLHRIEEIKVNNPEVVKGSWCRWV